MKYIYIFLFLLFHTISSAQTPKPRISKADFESLKARVKTENVKNDKVKIISDKFGNITSVECKQAQLKNLFKNFQLVPTLKNNELITVSSTVNVSVKEITGFEIVDLSKDSVAGQIFTAVKLSKLTNAKKCNDALKLFSKEMRSRREALKSEDQERFMHWCEAWALPARELEEFVHYIIEKKGQGDFVFEEGEWKVDEN